MQRRQHARQIPGPCPLCPKLAVRDYLVSDLAVDELSCVFTELHIVGVGQLLQLLLDLLFPALTQHAVQLLFLDRSLFAQHAWSALKGRLEIPLNRDSASGSKAVAVIFGNEYRDHVT
eukprot:3145382-Rhodomonas_salina.1